MNDYGHIEELSVHLLQTVITLVQIEVVPLSNDERHLALWGSENKLLFLHASYTQNYFFSCVSWSLCATFHVQLLKPSGHYMYRQLNIQQFYVLPTQFIHSVWISEQTAIISLYNINWLVFITGTECVYCSVRTGYLYTASLTFNNPTFCPRSVFMCFVWIWEQTVIISLYNINWLVCITETECVYCAVRTGYLNKIQVDCHFYVGACSRIYFRVSFVFACYQHLNVVSHYFVTASYNATALSRPTILTSCR